MSFFGYEIISTFNYKIYSIILGLFPLGVFFGTVAYKDDSKSNEFLKGLSAQNTIENLVADPPMCNKPYVYIFDGLRLMFHFNATMGHIIFYTAAAFSFYFPFSKFI